MVGIVALKIHMSENARDALVEFPEFITEPRGDITVKVWTYYYARQLYRQVLLRARISYGDSVCPSVRLGWYDPVPNQAQAR